VKDYTIKPAPTATHPDAVTVTTPTGDVKRFINEGHAHNWITYAADRRRHGRRR
jgi:hypothetical protein